VKRLLVPAVCLVAAAAPLANVKILGYWWENPLPGQAVPEGLTSLRASDCGVCHSEIYREWQASTHAQALSDRQFQAEMAKDAAVAWLCLNCHTPLENQLARIAVGVRNGSTHQPIFRKNPRYDAALAREGVTCAVCHVRDGVILGPYGDSKAPHPVRRAPELLTVEGCALCHQANAAYTDTLVCTFDTAEEWRQSPYAARGEACSGCHMPAVKRVVGVGGPERTSRRHLFLGSKIPKEIHVPVAQRAFYDLFSSGLSVEVRRGGLVLQNARAGHLLPTGDPERFLLVKAELLDATGKVVERATHRIGQEWEWHPTARKLSDNRLKPLERREVELPRHAAARRVRVTVENWRLNDRNAEYHKLRGVYPQFAVVQRTEHRLP
jgi:hypothetical protein